MSSNPEHLEKVYEQWREHFAETRRSIANGATDALVEIEAAIRKLNDACVHTSSLPSNEYEPLNRHLRQTMNAITEARQHLAFLRHLPAAYQAMADEEEKA